MSDDSTKSAEPLGTLIRTDASSLPLSPAHRRVLEVPGSEGNSLVLVCWQDPGGVGALHAELKRTVEACLLAELSRTAEDLATLDRSLTSLRLLCFEEPAGDVAAAVRPFGLERVPVDGRALREVLAHVRGEAQRVGLEIEGPPMSAWEAPMRLADANAPARLWTLERGMIERLGAVRWGARPGSHFAVLRQLLAEREGWELTPDADGLDRLEALLVSEEPGPIRFIPPTLFQALCDTIAVVAVKDHGREVQWAESVVEDDGLASPPVVRAKLGADWVHIPLGTHVLRWCVMPLMPGEDAPRLSAWVHDQFGGA